MSDPKDTTTPVEETLETIASETETPQTDAATDPVSDLEKTITELRASLARSQADYQNLLMRVDRDKAEMIHFLSAKIFTPLLTQIDHLDRAVKIKEGVEGDTFVDGVRNLQNGLEKYLESQGVTAFTSVGQEVDPDRHDVLSQADGSEGKIVSEFEKGYTLGDRVIRHAKVIVGNGNT